MFEALFGTEMPLALRFFIAFLFVLGLIGGAAYLVRRFGSGALNAGAARGRQPRLAVIDAAPVDGRRRLVLIRRDNVEHLIMIGGPTDVVVEPNIVRAAPAATGRESAPARVGADSLPRAAPMSEGTMWPLQPEPAPRAQRPTAIAEEQIWPTQMQPEPPPREAPLREAPLREAPPREAPPREPPYREPPLRATGGDRLAGLAAELSRATAPSPEHGSPPPRPVAADSKRSPAPPAAAPAAPVHAQASSEDQNLADMAHRLEVALRRPGQSSEAAPAEPAMTRPVSEPPGRPNPVPEPQVRPNMAADLAMPLGQRQPTTADTPRPVDARAARPEAKSSTKAVYDSLEQEMASLLGRPAGKS